MRGGGGAGRLLRDQLAAEERAARARTARQDGPAACAWAARRGGVALCSLATRRGEAAARARAARCGGVSVRAPRMEQLHALGRRTRMDEAARGWQTWQHKRKGTTVVTKARRRQE